jgi:hypothetical protein
MAKVGATSPAAVGYKWQQPRRCGRATGPALGSSTPSRITSPRGPVTLDPDTREMIQNIYIRKVERVGGELYNVEFATIPNYKDPSKEKR